MIGLHGIEKSFGARRVLEGVSLQVAAGQIYGLLGPNGCGKSTTINLICGRLRPDSGDIALHDASGAPLAPQAIGVVTQELALYPELSCRDQLDFFAALYGADRASRRHRIAALLDEFELTAYADTPAQQLSGGWKRRLHLAIALVHSPKLLILDEPTASVDIGARHGLWQLIRRQRDAGTTVLLTTHHLDEAEQLCDRIAILHAGRVLAEGSPEQIRARVPAQAIAMLDAEALQPLRDRANQLGLASRDYGGRLAVLLPQPQSLVEVIRQFDGLALRSLSLQPVSLDHAFLQLTGAHEPAALGL